MTKNNKKKSLTTKTYGNSMRLSEEDIAIAKLTGILKPEDSIISKKQKPKTLKFKKTSRRA